MLSTIIPGERKGFADAWQWRSVVLVGLFLGFFLFFSLLPLSFDGGECVRFSVLCVLLLLLLMPLLLLLLLSFEAGPLPMFTVTCADRVAVQQESNVKLYFRNNNSTNRRPTAQLRVPKLTGAAKTDAASAGTDLPRGTLSKGMEKEQEISDPIYLGPIRPSNERRLIRKRVARFPNERSTIPDGQDLIPEW